MALSFAYCVLKFASETRCEYIDPQDGVNAEIVGNKFLPVGFAAESDRQGWWKCRNLSGTSAAMRQRVSSRDTQRLRDNSVQHLEVM